MIHSNKKNIDLQKPLLKNLNKIFNGLLNGLK